jgi:osmotically-inducible protein OsmY
MRVALWSLMLCAALAFAAGCRSTSGKTAGESMDDTAITTQVKSKLAAERFSTLTKVDVDTNRGTVYLTGNVPDENTRQRAAMLAGQVDGVREVVNNLKLEAPR